ncbi:MAG: DUF4765 family protein [Chlamydiales bacterium]
MFKTLHKSFGKVFKPGPKPFDQDTAIVWRGCGRSQLLEMVKEGSAGGETANANTSLPEKGAVQKQVGESARLPEFTFSQNVAEHFATGGFVAMFEIGTRYLALGSKAEMGVVCNPDAPIQLVGWKKGRSLLQF